MSESLQDIHAVLATYCKELSKPGNKSLDMSGLVAWRDDLVMTAHNFTDAREIFQSAHEAFLARFRFARLNFEKSHGPSELFAEEYACAPEVDELQEPTGSIELHVQFVLKSLTSKPSQS